LDNRLCLASSRQQYILPRGNPDPRVDHFEQSRLPLTTLAWYANHVGCADPQIFLSMSTELSSFLSFS